MDQELARRVVDDGEPALAGFDLTDDEASRSSRRCVRTSETRSTR